MNIRVIYNFFALILELFTGCRHTRVTFPQSPRRVTRYQPGALPAIHSVSASYTVCLDCGAKFHYDWDHMRMSTQRSKLSRPIQDRTQVTQPLVDHD